MTNISIKVKVIALNIVSIFIILLTIIILFLNGTLSLHEDNFKNYEIDLMKSRKSEIKCQIDTASKAMESFYNESKPQNISKSIKNRSSAFKKELIKYYDDHKGLHSKKQLKSEIKSFVESHRYDDGVGYYWINDFDYRMIMHPIKPSFDGKKFIDTPKVPFVALGVDALKKSGSKNAMISYKFLNPKSKNYEDKISSVFVFEPFGWIIGTGAYKTHLENRLKQEAIKVVNNLSYGESGYFWINDIDGKMISHPKVKLVGKNFTNNKQVPFVDLGVEIAKKSGEGFANYEFPKKSSSKYEPKISYIKYFSDWKWMIGTGVYVDDIDKKIAMMKQSSSEKIDSLLLVNILATFFVMFAFTLITLLTVKNSISKPINKFKDKILEISNNHDLRERE